MNKTPRRFTVALSFAGENRSFIQNVSNHLCSILGNERVFYDINFQEELARPNLDTHLMDIYKNQSELIVFFMCENYKNKEWCGLEWRVIREIIKQKKDAEIMPFRFDEASLDGFLSIDGYLEVGIKSPEEVANLILKRLKTNQMSEGPFPSGNETIPVTEARNVSFVEDEIDKEIRKKFKLFSPASKEFYEGSAPKQGETWSLSQTLPSGHFPAFGKGADTHSISWHPDGYYLLTAGTGNITKLWSTSTGSLLTEKPIWDSNSYWQTISWSPDKKMFVSGRHVFIFDGLGIKRLYPPPFTLSSGYLNDDYGKIRGFRGYMTHQNTSHLSSNNNFSPWRPGSKQIITKREEENLILTNCITGEPEKTINCTLICKPNSSVRDFAWHPSGDFIAISFEEHNICIIEIDTDRRIDTGLSAQYIVGWSPDGKLLVARKERFKDNFVIWDSMDQKEKPMPDDLKKEIWFKRFFRNISADGLRYVEIQLGEAKTYEGCIYSVDSEELLFTFPKKVTMAAWSPIEGGKLATCGDSETDIWKLR